MVYLFSIASVRRTKVDPTYICFKEFYFNSNLCVIRARDLSKKLQSCNTKDAAKKYTKVVTGAKKYQKGHFHILRLTLNNRMKSMKTMSRLSRACIEHLKGSNMSFYTFLKYILQYQKMESMITLLKQPSVMMK